MMDKDTYKRELVRMLDSLRINKYKGQSNCNGVDCEECPLHGFNHGCSDALSSLEIYCAVEKWSKEHPQKHKVSKLEYDILKIYIDLECYGTFNGYAILSEILKKGYFAGATSKTNIRDYFNNCEVKEDV